MSVTNLNKSIEIEKQALSDTRIVSIEEATEIVDKILEKKSDKDPGRTDIQKNQPPAQRTPTTQTTSKLEEFIRLCQQGSSTAMALRQSGLLSPEAIPTYTPGFDDEVAIEEIFLKRAASYKPKVLDDDTYMAMSAEERTASYERGEISTTQLYKLVDWLYFVRALPLKAIAGSLQVPVNTIAEIKANISNDFSRTIKAQTADGYIGDLLRTKEMLRADITMRRGKLPVTDSQHIQLNKLLWELENKFIDRLQEVGFIDKTLGRLDVHEEWEVTLSPIGSPINRRMESLAELSKELEHFDTGKDKDSDKDLDPGGPDKPKDVKPEDIDNPQSSAPEPNGFSSLQSRRRLGMSIPSSVIKVGPQD